MRQQFVTEMKESLLSRVHNAAVDEVKKQQAAKVITSLTEVQLKDMYFEERDKSAAYQAFFKGKLKAAGVSSPDELEGDKKKEFFNQVDKEWKAKKESD